MSKPLHPGDPPQFLEGRWNYPEPSFEPFPRPGRLVEIFSTVREVDMTEPTPQFRSDSILVRLMPGNPEEQFRNEVRFHLGNRYAGWRYVDL